MLTLEELRKKDLKDLMAELKKAKEAKLASALSVRMNQDKQSHLIQANKIYIAQIKTVIREKEVASKEAKAETTEK